MNSSMLRELVRRLTGTQPMRRRRINGSPGSSIAAQIGASRKNRRIRGNEGTGISKYRMDVQTYRRTAIPDQLMSSHDHGTTHHFRERLLLFTFSKPAREQQNLKI